MKQIIVTFRISMTRIQYLAARAIYDKSSWTTVSLIEVGGYDPNGRGVVDISGDHEECSNIMDHVLRDIYNTDLYRVNNPDDDGPHPVIHCHISYGWTS